MGAAARVMRRKVSGDRMTIRTVPEQEIAGAATGFRRASVPAGLALEGSPRLSSTALPLPAMPAVQTSLPASRRDVHLSASGGAVPRFSPFTGTLAGPRKGEGVGFWRSPAPVPHQLADDGSGTRLFAASCTRGDGFVACFSTARRARIARTGGRRAGRTRPRIAGAGGAAAPGTGAPPRAEADVCRASYSEVASGRAYVPDVGGVEDGFVQQARAVVEARMGDWTFSTVAFAEEMHLSVATLNRRLKALTGMAAGAFVRERRLLAACRHLEAGRSVKHTADAVGYRDVEYFSRLFHCRHGIVPSRWARRSSAGRRQTAPRGVRAR